MIIFSSELGKFTDDAAFKRIVTSDHYWLLWKSFGRWGPLLSNIRSYLDGIGEDFPHAWWFLNVFVRDPQSHYRFKYIKHCQRHNGPEGWVLVTKVTYLGHITNYHTNLEQTSSESRPSTNYKISTKHQQNFNLKILTKPSFRISTKI